MLRPRSNRLLEGPCLRGKVLLFDLGGVLVESGGLGELLGLLGGSMEPNDQLRAALGRLGIL